jgi:hypothetical protein
MAGYGTDEAFASWLAATGRTLPDGAVPAALRQIGSTYIDATYGPRFVGTPTGGYDQERAWPRTGGRVYGSDIPDDTVPQAVIFASYEAAYQEAVSPGVLIAVGSTAARVKRERVEGAVEVEYQSTSGSRLIEDLTPIITVIEGMLAPFLIRHIPAILVV